MTFIFDIVLKDLRFETRDVRATFRRPRLIARWQRGPDGHLESRWQRPRRPG